jgi:hypothetical protein
MLRALAMILAELVLATSSYQVPPHRKLCTGSGTNYEILIATPGGSLKWIITEFTNNKNKNIYTLQSALHNNQSGTYVGESFENRY